jgi:hypothetical protein
MRREFLRNLRIREDTIAAHWLKSHAGAADRAEEEWEPRIAAALREIFAALERADAVAEALRRVRTCVPTRDCQHNPLPRFFVAGEAALRDGVGALEAKLPPGARRAEDLETVLVALRWLARREIDAHCAACAHRGTAEGCRYARGPRAE